MDYLNFTIGNHRNYIFLECIQMRGLANAISPKFIFLKSLLIEQSIARRDK